MQGITFGLVFQHTTVGTAELSLIESLTKTLGSFGHFFVYLVIVLGKLVLYQHIGTITFLGIAVVNQRVIESVHVSAGFPDSGVHKDSRVDADNIFVQQYHTLPPVLLDVIFQFHTHLTIVIHSSQSIINLAGREHKTIFLTV